MPVLSFEDRLRAALRSEKSSNRIALNFGIQLKTVRRMRATIYKSEVRGGNVSATTNVDCK